MRRSIPGKPTTKKPIGNGMSSGKRTTPARSTPNRAAKSGTGKSNFKTAASRSNMAKKRTKKGYKHGEDQS